ncbi:ABC transporter permease [Pseudoalteromonas sp. SMS1]|uniref:ABC transporter permease n=1 Tax=Pseudoalteromonas sp. SMS1 TaxID=2908894 RepID=UPI001F4141A3|nr:ABC transporter permease [Pseudoalteromonas sp. SMS1]MCF2856435.1 ABC transporter permease [Pseudoalteromonas sp. SMS1]
MIATIAIGIAATMITYTVNYMMTQDPVPGKSDRLFTVHLSSWDPNVGYRMKDGKEDIPIFMTYQDATNLYTDQRAHKQTIISFHKAMVRSAAQPRGQATMTYLRPTTHEFFSMLNVPFLYGSPWDASDDSQGSQIVVLSKKKNEQLFQGENSLGREVVIGGLIYRVVGVLDEWLPLPRFYTERSDSYSEPRGLFVPFQSSINNDWLSGTDGSVYCWGGADLIDLNALKASECVWLFYWVELASAELRDDYLAYINRYAQEQKALGRFQREQMNRVMNVAEFIEYNEVVNKDGRIAVWLAMAFLIACLLNTMSLMMTKFHGKGAEVGLRRAVGASKVDIARQFFCETVIIGLAGGAIGLVLALLGLYVTSEVYSHLHAGLMEMNLSLMLLTIGSSVLASTVFGLYPIYKACQIQPSSQLKSL